ncbi:RNA-binding family protein isoform 2 [Hibiscus syriacus]|uniref:RNA-binding family protein isoform 2 n=1 Tax=Hibiscus syriacus TaxID=106335 RepID=A0A6A3A8D4_HIBSY|nr:RNA-binding family protein isoform 2 [Hibiscus syriacus]
MEEEVEYEELELKMGDENRKHAELLVRPPHGSEVYIGGIPHDASQEDLKGFCEFVGEVTEVQIMKGKDLSENKSFAVVTFRSVELASKAIDELNNVEFKMKAIMRKDGCLAAISERPVDFTDDNKWIEMDGNAMINFHLALADEVLSSIEEKKTTKEIWDHLTKLYEATSLYNKIFLKRKLYTLRMPESTSVTEHLNTLNTLFSQLTSLRCKIGEQERAELLLQSLSDSYDQLIINLTNSNVTSLVFDDVAATVLQEENRRKNKEARQINLQQAEALTTTRGRSTERDQSSSHKHSRSKSRSKKNLKCYNCGKKGHLKKDCWSLNKNSNPHGNTANTSDDGEALCCEASTTVEVKLKMGDENRKHAELLVRPPHGSEVYIGGIPRDASQEDLKGFCEFVGEVIEVQIMKGKDLSENKSFAVVTFRSVELASKAIDELNNVEFKGRKIKCSTSQSKNQLFIGNLPRSWREEHLRKVLSEVGPRVTGVELVKDMKNLSNSNRCFAFVEYFNNACAEYSRQKKMNQEFRIDDNTPTVSWADPKTADSPAASQGMGIGSWHNRLGCFILTLEVMGSSNRNSHFAKRSCAMKALNSLEKFDLGGQIVECSLAKPLTDRKSPHRGSSLHTSGLLPNYPPHIGYGLVGGAYGVPGLAQVRSLHV